MSAETIAYVLMEWSGRDGWRLVDVYATLAGAEAAKAHEEGLRRFMWPFWIAKSWQIVAKTVKAQKVEA